jgi:hypothetical protein
MNARSPRNAWLLLALVILNNIIFSTMLARWDNPGVVEYAIAGGIGLLLGVFVLVMVNRFIDGYYHL